MRLVLLRDGRALPAPDAGRRHVPALPRRPRRLLRHRHRPGLPLQPGPHLARAAGDLLRLHLVRGRRDLPGADDRGAGAERTAQARLLPARGPGGRRLRQPDRRVRRHPQLVLGLDLRRPGLRVPRPRALLAGAADRRALRLDLDPLPRPARTPQQGARRQHALALLPGRAGDPGLLRGRAARQLGRQLHDHRLLALLGRPPLGGGLPGALHHRDGRLHLRPARRGPRAGRAHRSSCSTSSSTRSAG